MLTIEGTEIRYDGEIVGYLIANRGMQMVVKEWLEDVTTPIGCDCCNKDAEKHVCMDCYGL
jgi:hypothetical protein